MQATTRRSRGIDYLRDPEEITRQSFAAIRREVDLTGLAPAMTAMAARLVHACGMPDIVGDLACPEDAVDAGRAALAAGAPVLVAAEMVAHGIIRARLPADNAVLCTLNRAPVRGQAKRLGITRSAAAVALWRPHLEGAVVAIGNAPTALFRLLELIAEGAPRPALILGFPVGFVGAAEAKAALAAAETGIAFATLLGRRGGSALAAAAVNALAAEVGPEAAP